MFFDVVDSVVVLFEAICCQMFFDVFYDEDEERRDTVTGIIAIVVLFFLYVVLSRLLAFNFLLKEVAVIAAIMATMCLTHRIALKKSVLFASLYQGLLVAMEYVAYIIVQKLFPDIKTMSDEEEMLGRLIVIIDLMMMLLLVAVIRRRLKGHKYRVLYEEEWVKFIAFPIFTIITVAAILSSFGSIEDIQQRKVLYCISLGLMAMNFFVFYLLEDIVKKEEIIREKGMYETQSRNQLEMYSMKMICLIP